jgi:hypothetical protein
MSVRVDVLEFINIDGGAKLLGFLRDPIALPKLIAEVEVLGDEFCAALGALRVIALKGVCDGGPVLGLGHGRNPILHAALGVGSETGESRAVIRNAYLIPGDHQGRSCPAL